MIPRPAPESTDGNAEQDSEISSHRSTGTPSRIALAKWLYWARNSRPDMDVRMFGEPAWDMILDLYVHQAKGASTNITAACIGSNTPVSTAMRYVDLLCIEGWAEKIRDENDKRRSMVALTPYAVDRMDEYLDHLLKRMRRVLPEFFPEG